MLLCKPGCNHRALFITLSSTRQTFHGFLNLARKYGNFPKALSREQSRVVLGVSRDATKQEIKKAFLNLSKSLHPDVNKSDNATEEFQRAKNAYDTLTSGGYENISDDYDMGDQESSVSQEFKNWKSRRQRTNNVDEYLREVQRKNTEWMGWGWSSGESEEGSKRAFNRESKSDFEPLKFRSDIETEIAHMEKPFITFVNVFSQSTYRIPSHSVFILKLLMTTAILLSVLGFAGVLFEMYGHNKLDEVHDVKSKS